MVRLKRMRADSLAPVWRPQNTWKASETFVYSNLPLITVLTDSDSLPFKKNNYTSTPNFPSELSTCSRQPSLYTFETLYNTLHAISILLLYSFLIAFWRGLQLIIFKNGRAFCSDCPRNVKLHVTSFNWKSETFFWPFQLLPLPCWHRSVHYSVAWARVIHRGPECNTSKP